MGGLNKGWETDFVKVDINGGEEKRLIILRREPGGDKR